MRERFPQFILTRGVGGTLVWRGVLEPVRGSRFEITATMPTDYPYTAPALHVIRPRLRSSAPHLYQGTMDLCVHKATWIPMRGTVASMIPLASAWLVAYLNWERTGEAF
jgi:hypothetical protein